MLLVAGSLTIDRIYRCERMPEEGGTVCGSASVHVGGYGGIEALAALRSGAKARLAAAIGDDEDGRLLRNLLSQHGLSGSALSVCADAPTGSSSTLLDDSGYYWRVDALAANALFEAGPEVEQQLDSAKMLLCQCDANPRSVHRLMSAARARRIPTVLHAAPARPEALKMLAPLADVVVADENGFSDLVRLFHPSGLGDFTGEQIHALSDVRLGEMCRATVAGDLVILLGARGAFVSERDGSHKLVGDATGPVSRSYYCCAQETFVGALCARILDGDALKQAVRYAIVASSMPGPMGGQDAIPRWGDVLARMERC